MLHVTIYCHLAHGAGIHRRVCVCVCVRMYVCMRDKVRKQLKKTHTTQKTKHTVTKIAPLQASHSLASYVSDRPNPN